MSSVFLEYISNNTNKLTQWQLLILEDVFGSKKHHYLGI